MQHRSRIVTLPLTSLALALASGCAEPSALDAEGSSGEVESTGDGVGADDPSTGGAVEPGMSVMTTTGAPRPDEGDDAGGCAPGSVERCTYGGPPRTVNVGSCRAGARRCDEDGRWGACEGEVRPQVEDCRTPVDEDCDGRVVCTGEVTWARGFGQPEGGAASYATSEALVIDRHERLWITGSFSGALRIDGEGWDLPGQQTMFMARLGAGGAPQLAFADTAADACGYGSRLAIGRFGAVAVSAGDCGALRLAPGAPTHVVSEGWHASVVGVFSEAGDFLRDVALLGDADGPFDVKEVAFDRAGNLWVAGSFLAGTATLGEGDDAQVLAGAGQLDAVVVKLGPDGAILWAQALGDAASQTIEAIAVDEAGDVWIAGAFQGSMQFAGGSLSSGKGPNDWSSFVVKLDGDGAWQWGRAYSSAKTQAFKHLRVDAAGDAVLAGYYVGPSMTLDNRHLSNDVSNSAMLVARLDAHGTPMWATSWPCVGACYLDSMALDGAGQSVVSTLLEPGSAVLVGDEFSWAQGKSERGVVVKLDRDGALVWGPRSYHADVNLAVGPTGAIYMTGSHAGQLRLGDAPDLNLDAGDDGEDVYVARARP